MLVVSYAAANGAYDLSWWTVDGGGGSGATASTGGSYSLSGSIGQPDAGTSSGGIYALVGGFWSSDWDGAPPGVVSSLRANPNPTNAANVDFTVTFSESVSGVDATDFTLNTSGVTGASVSGVSGSSTTYTVTVNTGNGDGTIRLDVLDDDTIVDTAGNPLDGGYTSGETYTIDKTAPDTQIDSHPADPSISADADFIFSSTDGTATFECVLDGGAYAVCTSPKNYTGLDDNSHTFAVRAKDPVGNVDATPASFTWTIDTHVAGIRYVTPDGTGNCSSWATACTLQYALIGGVSGDEIWAAVGTYTPTTGTDRNATFQLKSGVAVYGGFAVTETLRTQRDPTANVTILSGDLSGNDNGNVAFDEPTRADNSYHVVTGADNATLDGFTITAGNASGSDCPGAACGGGMVNNTSSPTLTNVTFISNSANYGGGMANLNSSPALMNITFSSNSSHNGGGGMHNQSSSNPTLTNVTFSGNSAVWYGGGLRNSACSPTLMNVTFNSNSADRGGGMYNGSSFPTIRNTVFWGNAATTAGAQVYNGSSAPVVSDSVVQDGCPAGSTCSNIITTDPLLDALGDYGGATQTIPLQAGSSAIDAGNAATCATADQRGQARNDLRCDIGAYEVKPSDRHWDRRWVSSTDLTTYGPTLVGIQRDAAFMDPGVITVTKNTNWARLGSESIQTWWKIMPTETSSISLTLELCYLDSESNLQTLANLRFWRLGGGTWSPVGDIPTTSRDAFGNNCATISGVTELSVWTLATDTPTAIKLRSFKVDPLGPALGTLAVFAGSLLIGGVGLILAQRIRKQVR